MIAAVAHKNCNSSRTPTRKLQTTEIISVFFGNCTFAISDLLTISSRALPSEHYTSGMGGLEVLHKCYNTDVLGVLLIYPLSPLCIYVYQIYRILHWWIKGQKCTLFSIKHC